jgi:peptidoglycan/LPS O-acetylase OafA/YrhL
MGSRTSGFYRHDLDGLRGVAIVMVAVFHIWFGRVSGGVDVFLALSGFFFGGRLLRAALTPGVSLRPGREVIRLGRRLLPALVVVLAAAAVLTILVQPETRWETFADQSLASLGYYQNWELANTASDYLRAGETVSPLQHIWSMSVQGQFYIAFLALILGLALLLRRVLRRHLKAVFVVLLTALTVASFVYAIIAHNADQATAYYNSFARAWELLLGALAGALVQYVRWPMWLRTIVATVALAAILACGALIDGVKEFPGPWALVPVGATILFVLSAANRLADPHTGGRLPAPNRLLASAPFVALGAMAYSLYLWHWPLLIFWLSYTGHQRASLLDGAGVLVVSGVLAWLTTRYIEEPLRYRAPVGTIPAVPLRTRLGGRAARRCADRDLVHVARTRHRRTRQRQGAVRAVGPRLPRRAGAAQPGEGAQAADAAHGARGQEGPARHHQRRLHQRLRQHRCDQLHLRRQDRDPHHRAGRRLTRRALGHRARPAGPAAQLPRGHLPEDGLPAHHRRGAAGDGRQPAVPEVPPVERTGDGQTDRRPPRLRVHHLDPAVDHQTG